MTSRRELLKLMAAAPLLACRAPKASRTIQGSIVGGRHALGHRLRETGALPAPSRTLETEVAILGAGLAGLSAAWALERAGLRDFLVFELEDAPGGTARYGEGPVTPYPWAAHYVPVPDPENRALVALLAEVGALAGRDAQGQPLWAEEVLCREPEERIFFRGEWFEGLYPRIGASAADLRQLEAFEAEMRRLSSRRDARGRRVFALPRARSGRDAEAEALDGQSLAGFLAARGLDSPRLVWLAEYGCRDDFGATLAQTSAWAGVHYYAARLAAPDAEPDAVLTWPEGNGRLVRHLADLAGARLRTGHLVLEANPARDRVEALVLDAARGEVVRVRARHGVFALPRFVAPRVVAPWRAEPPGFLRESVYGSWMVANLTLRDRPRAHGFPLAWDNVLYDSPSLGYVVATHQSGSDHGATVFTYYLPLLDEDPAAGRTRLLAAAWPDWVGQILDDLRPAHPDIDALVERIDVYLWGHAMVRPRPGFLFSEALAASARPLGRLRFAHTDLSGMALCEEAQHWGLRAAASILQEEKRALPEWMQAAAD